MAAAARSACGRLPPSSRCLLAARLGMGRTCRAFSASGLAAMPEPAVLLSAPGFVVLDKPSGWQLSCQPKRPTEPSLVAWLQSRAPGKEASLCQMPGQMEAATSGAVFVATSRAVELEAAVLREDQRVAEVYTALVRGRLQLQDLIRCHRRLCRPSEDSSTWRLAGTRREGQEACTLVRGLCHGKYSGEDCTLVELLPVTSCPQQLRLHCVALGHPIVGDEEHGVDRRLDWRFEEPLTAPRLLLHCWRLRVPLSKGIVEAVAPDPLGPLLDVSPSEHCLAVPQDMPASGSGTGSGDAGCLIDEAVVGLTTQLSAADAWSEFAGGLGNGVIDDTHWDVAQHLRTCRSPPYGPLEWDHRARAASEHKMLAGKQ